jgi:site-specific DNA-methyltransferase (adenine-specific)
MENKIYNDDCFNIFEKIENKVIDLVLVDLPYGQTSCDWDICIDLKKMWKNLKRICKDKCQFVFFTTTRFGYKLIESNPKWFRYDLVWEKYIAVGFLNANKMPLRSHEMIYIFSSQNTDDIELSRNIEMREYGKNVLKFIDKTSKQIERELGHRKAEHFLQRTSTTQFSLPTEKTYNELIEKYNIDKMEGYLTFDNLKKYERKEITKIYNPQKTPGKPWKSKECNLRSIGVYGSHKLPAHENITGDRHPKSVLKYNQSSEKLHPTQKPIELCEWLIKTYSNEGDLVFDFCMGSGTSILASINTNRKYIGIEKDKDIYETAKKRLNLLV